MAENCDNVASQYDSIAGEWAEAFRGEHEKKPKDQEMLERFCLAVGERGPVWDLGCGTGHTSKYLKDRGVRISGLDLSEGMLERARACYPEIHFQKGNILELEFEDGSIAGIVAFYTVVHFTTGQMQTALREIFRVLKGEGIFLFSYHVGEGKVRIREFMGKKVDLELVFFKSEYISQALRDAGFDEIEIIEREPYPEVEYHSTRAYVFARKPGREAGAGAGRHDGSPRPQEDE